MSELWQMGRFANRTSGHPAEFEPGTKRHVKLPEPRGPKRPQGQFVRQPRPKDGYR